MKKRPKILLLDHTAALGGAEFALLRLLSHLDRSRFDCRVLLFSDGPLAAQLRAAGVPVHILPLSAKVTATSRYEAGRALFRFEELTATLRHVWRVARFLRAHDIDLVHTHSLKSNVIGGAASRLARRPCIWHLHMGLTDDYMPPLLAKVFRLLTRTVPQYLIANSEATLRSVHASGRKPSWVIYPGIQLDDFAPPAEALAHEALPATDGITSQPSSPAPEKEGARPGQPAVVGIIGRISATKGQHVFLQAAAQVLRQLPAVRFQVIGSAFFNDLAYEEEIHRLAGSLGIAAAVEFIGFVRDVPARLHALDVFVLASTTPEPFGQILVEAMASGTPVVATDAGGVPEIVTHRHTGLLVAPGDADQLAAAICELLGHPEQTAAMARRGQARAAERFTIERTAREVEAVYAQVLL